MLNKTIIQGRLVRDVELRQTGTGTPVASLTVAWSEKYKDTERKLFMPCVAWGNNAEFATKYFSKGQEICVEGYLTSRQWTDKDGNGRETIELTVDRLHFCGKREAAPAFNMPEGNADFNVIEDDGDLPF
ncbi:MAG: single-stranded DNA-binding protein [Clostridia bacterium]|nr:single-stranded DNA-binding protein [Clostridia bacterium]